MQEDILFPLSGGIAGASVYSTMGGIGIIGGFGGLGLGAWGMTAAGAFAGCAVYGVVKGVEDSDANIFTATGLGVIGGIGASKIVGGIGVSLGGSAFGVGMCSMAAMGGIFGLGIYGLAKMFDDSQTNESFAETFDRLEERIFYEEAYWQAMLELDNTFAEISLRHKFVDLEIEEELEKLKAQNRAKKKLKSAWNTFNNSDKFVENDLEEDFIKIESKSFEIEQKENFVWKSIKTLKGHTREINSLAIQDNIIASSSSDCTVGLWDIEAGKNIFFFFETSEVDSIAINDQIVVAGNQRRNITSWKLQNNTLSRTFSRNPYDSIYGGLHNHDCHDGLIYALVLKNNSQTLLSSSGDKLIKAWNTSTGEFMFALAGHTDEVISLAISSSNRYLISGSKDKTIRIWDLNNLSLESQIITDHEDWVTSLAISKDEKYLVSGSKDKTVKLWDFSSLKQVYSLKNDSFICSVAISPDSSTIASGSKDKIVRLWDVATGRMLETLQASAPVVFSQNGKYLITGNSKNQIVIWQRISVNQQFMFNDGIVNQWWTVLGVEQNISVNELKTAYYDLARHYHPDLNISPEAKHKMQIINQAYNEAIKSLVLS